MLGGGVRKTIFQPDRVNTVINEVAFKKCHDIVEKCSTFLITNPPMLQRFLLSPSSMATTGMSMEVSKLGSWFTTCLPGLQPTYIGVIIYLLTTMDTLVESTETTSTYPSQLVRYSFFFTINHHHLGLCSLARMPVTTRNDIAC